MSEIIKPNTGLLFMKVGLHSGETFDDILKRKREEYNKTGMIFWGYGGGTCHPTRVVQPFAKMRIEVGDNIYIAMEEINSNHPFTKMIAKEYSEDGINWKPIPTGIEVRGSRYAVVLDEIQDGDLDIDLCEYSVGYGRSMGKNASDYIGGRVDKACIIKNSDSSIPIHPNRKKITHFAKIKDPFAVFVR